MQKVIMFLKNMDTERVALYSGALLLLILLIAKGSCNSKKKTAECPTWEDIRITYADSIESLAASTYSVIEDNPQPTDTIVKERVVYRDHTTFVKNWHDLQNLRAQYNTLRDEYDRALSQLDLTQEQLDSALLAGPMILTVEAPATEPAVIRTEKNEKTDEYEIKESIMSRGPLVNFSRSVKVYPKTITVTKTEVEYLKKNRTVSVGAGALYLDDFDNLYYTPSLGFGNNWLMLEGSALLDNNTFKYSGAQAALKVMIRYNKK